MFSSQKILKPDVPPKRRNTASGFLGRWFRLLAFVSTHRPGAVGKSFTEQRRTAERKRFRGDRV
jgi:hypothetical protein